MAKVSYRIPVFAKPVKCYITQNYKNICTLNHQGISQINRKHQTL